MRWPLTITLFTVLAGTVGAADDPAAAKGSALLAPLKQQLMGALKEGMAQGPAEAVEKCRLVAPGIPAAVAPEGVKMGRTSHKLRNPDNAPTQWQRELLQYYLQHDDRSPMTRTLEGGRMAYVEPIGVKPLCVTCHGKTEQIPDAVKARLEELYPEDQATGFSVGDFRGLFWVTWPGPAGDSQG